MFSTGLPDIADAVICPLPGINTGGDIYAPYAHNKINFSEIESLLKYGTVFLCGSFPEKYMKTLNAKGVKAVVTAELDEICFYNAVPTAEGAVAIALNESGITIHGSEALVLGFGRCAVPLAKLLQGMGSTVTVAARRRDALAQAYSLGFRTVLLEELERCIGGFDYIFNTIPAVVLHSGVLSGVKADALIIDIASNPGGTDFEAAAELGIKSILAPGLPGKTAPVSAGRTLAAVYLCLLIKNGKGGAEVET
jgi:dipicolinate synthase subunit A